MIAGLVLGPSCLGWLFPRWSATLFDPSTLGPLNVLSQLGLIVFMFLVGARLDVEQLRAARRVALTTSVISIAVPFACGMALALHLQQRLAPPGVAPLTFSLFVGIALSITAFPVLARILSDHGLTATRVGSVAIACAAFDDVTGWMILAVLDALVVSGNAYVVAFRTLTLFAVYLLAMLAVIRPLLRRFAARNRAWGESPVHFALVILLMFASAFVTERIGVHLLFGAFVAGLTVPPSRAIERRFRDWIEPFAIALLLPIFFAFIGLRTSVRLLDSAELWRDAALILFVAIAGKAGAAAVAARTAGLTWRDAIAVGVLLNTRGLVELVVLNIGLDLGILSQVMFSLLVLMALITTALTSPLLWFCKVSR